MTAKTSTYTYKSGEQETVTLLRGLGTPHGHALLKIKDGIGRIADCYVNTAWLRDRLNDLDPHPLTPDAITDEMVERARHRFEELDREMGYMRSSWVFRQLLDAALTEPPARPEGAEDIERVILDYKRENAHRGYSEAEIADRIAEEMNR